MDATVPMFDSPHAAVARSIAQRLAAAGHIAYFAGGCVRDALRGVAKLQVAFREQSAS